MATETEIGKCFLCLDKWLLKEQVHCQKERKIKDGLKGRNISLQNVGPIKSRLEVIHLLRKVLEIPQHICGNFLQDYSDSSSWIYSCESCSLLITESKTIFDQLMNLQNQYKTLQDKIKSIIIQSAQFDEFNGDQSKWGIKEMARSFIFEGQEYLSGPTANKLKLVKIADLSPESTDTDDDTISDLAHYRENTVIKVESCSSFKNEDIGSQEIDHIAPFGEYSGENRDIDLSSFVAVELIEEATKQGQDSEKPFKCDICGKCFKNKCTLNDHARLHTGEGLHYCSSCGKSFTRIDQLKNHMLTHTGEKPHKCSECGKCFARSDELNRHKRIHSEQKSFKCQFCGKRFKHDSSLKDHVKSHTGLEPHKCTICGKGFVKIDNFKRHMNSHTGRKPHACPDCGKSFATQHNLKVHGRIHTGEKPFRCRLCEKMFASSSTLTAHERIHTGEKPYKCGLCGKNFTTSGLLTVHKKSHT